MFDRVIKYLLPKLKAADPNELDPLDDDLFLAMENKYVFQMGTELNSSVRLIYDRTQKVILKMGVNYNEAQLYEAVKLIVRQELGAFLPNSLNPVIAEAVNKIYTHSRKQVTQATFKVIDNKAIDYLKSSDNFYVGKIYPEYSTEINKAIRETIFDQGLGAKDAAEAIRDVVKEEYAEKYFYRYERIARTSSNRVRNWSRTFAMSEEGIENVEFVALLDERTSEICKHLNGTIWTLSKTVEHLEKVMEAGEQNLPEASPFPKIDDLFTVDYDTIKDDDFETQQTFLKDTDTLTEEGIAVPPMHCNCRSLLVAVFL